MLTFSSGILAADTRAAAVAAAYEAAGLDPDDFETEIEAVVDRLDTILTDSAPETTSEAIDALLAVVADVIVASSSVLTGDRVIGGQAAVANIATADGSDPATTQALANATKATVNDLLAKLRAANVIDDA